jgi:hypothetical protein
MDLQEPPRIRGPKPGSNPITASRLPSAANVKEILTMASRCAALIFKELLPLFEAGSSLEFHAAMHNISDLGIRRLLEGYPRGVLT